MMEYYSVITKNSLYHHGIKGQKWGDKNGPPYPLDEEDHSVREKRAAKSHELSKSEKSAARAYRRNSGFTKSDAEVMARRQAMAKKIAIGVAVGALAAGTTYVVVKSAKDPNKDFTILPGTKIQRITPFNDNSVREQFYGAINKQDKNLYAIRMPDWKGDNLFKQELVPNKPVKVAGIDTCEKLFNELKSEDKNFQTAMMRTFGIFDSGRVDYDKFNTRMVDKSLHGEGNAFQLFQNALKDRGYGALVDYNDAKGGGWHTERPVIFFAQQDNMRSTIKELTQKNIEDAKKNYVQIENARKFVENNLPSIATAGGTSAFAAGLMYVSGASTDRAIIKEYKSLHPNSNLSNAQILEIFDRS